MTDETNLPSGWISVQANQIAEVRLGRQRSPDKVKGEHIRPYLRAANVTWDGLDLSDVKHMNFEPKEFETYRLHPGDILLSEASGSASEVGKPAVWRGEIEGACFQNTLIRVRSRLPLPDYLYYHFLADARLGRFADAGKGVGINHLGADRMSSWPLRLPPLAEQRRIVDKLEALSARSRRAKEALDAIPPLLERFRQSVLASAFRGDLTAAWREKNPDVEPADKLLARIRTERRRRWEEAELAKMRAKGKVPGDDRWKEKYEEPEPVDASELPELPEGWVWASVDEVASLVTKGSSPGWQGFDYCESGLLFVRSQNVGWGVLDLSDVAFLPYGFNDHEPRSILKEGDVLLNIVGASIGRAAVANAVLEGANINQAVALIRCVRAVMDPVVLMLWLISPKAQRVIHFGKVDVARANFSLNDIRRIAVPVPPASEQNVLTERLELFRRRADVMLESARGGQSSLQQLDRAILAKAFRGELVPQDPNDEPASVLLERIRAEADKNGTPARPGRRRREATVPLFPDLEGPAAQEPAKKKRARSPARAR